jgi:hypothetical protein
MGETLYKLAVLITIYKISCLLCGSLFCLLGFKLFLKGIYSNEGEVEFEGFKTKIYLKKVGPGIFFALFGAVIICVAIFQPLDFEQYLGESAKNKTQSKDTVSKSILPDLIK